jgi:hypothetical protein
VPLEGSRIYTIRREDGAPLETGVAVTSSDPSVIEVSDICLYCQGGQILLAGKHKGSATIFLLADDGSGQGTVSLEADYSISFDPHDVNVTIGRAFLLRLFDRATGQEIEDNGHLLFTTQNLSYDYTRIFDNQNICPQNLGDDFVYYHDLNDESLTGKVKFTVTDEGLRGEYDLLIPIDIVIHPDGHPEIPVVLVGMTLVSDGLQHARIGVTAIKQDPVEGNQAVEAFVEGAAQSVLVNCEGLASASNIPEVFPTLKYFIQNSEGNAVLAHDARGDKVLVTVSLGGFSEGVLGFRGVLRRREITP